LFESQAIPTDAPPAADAQNRIVELLERIADATEAKRSEALGPADAARFINISVAKLHDLNSRGLLPTPASIGDSDRLPRWSRTELRSWLLSGAPSRQRWTMMRESAMRRIA